MRIARITAFAACVAAAMTCLHAETWSLSQCIDHAIEHNTSLRMSEINIRAAELNVSEARSGYLPNVSASAGQSWNLGRGLTAQNTYADRNTSSFNWGVNGSITLFDGLATHNRIAYARANLLQVTEQFEAAKDDLTINVIVAYLQVLYARELNEVAIGQVELSEYELTRCRDLIEAGKLPEADIYDAEAQLAADRLQAVQTANDLQLALIDLAQLMKLNDPVGFDIAPLSDDEAMIIPADEVYQAALQHNHSIIAARQSINVADSNIAVARSAYLPTLSFGTSIGSQYYHVSGFSNDGFGSQMRHNYSTYFGFQLNIPIFDANNTRNRVRQARIERQNAMLQLDKVQEDLFRNIQQAYYQAVGCSNKLASSIVSEKAALKAFEAAQDKYNLGRATATEYQEAKAKAFRATAERIQAGYELILRSRILQFYANKSPYNR